MVRQSNRASHNIVLDKAITMTKQIELEIRGSIALLKINIQPINAFDENSLAELNLHIDTIDRDENIRVFLITSGIQGIFCTGGDLKFWPQKYPDQPDIVSQTGRDVFDRIERLDKPSIAVINGRVIGDGLSLALSCDIRIASNHSSFSLPEVEYGFIPGWGTIGRLLKLGGKSITTELLLLGNELTAERATNLGIIHYLTETDNLLPFAISIADRLSKKPPMAIHAAKSVIHGISAAQTDLAVSCEFKSFSKVWGSEEWRNGIESLFSKSE